MITFLIGVYFGMACTAMCMINKRWNTEKAILKAMQGTRYKERMSIGSISRWVGITPASVLRIIRKLRKKQYPIVFRPGGYYYAKDTVETNDYLIKLGKHTKPRAQQNTYNNMLHIVAGGITLDNFTNREV